jgi:hypothetical protein
MLPMQVITHFLDLGWRPDPPRGPDGPSSTSLTQVVGALGPSSSPPRGPAIDVFDTDGGFSQIFGMATQGPTIDIFKIGGECSQTSDIASQRVRHRCLHDRWWTLLDLRHHLIGGPLLTSLR